MSVELGVPRDAHAQGRTHATASRELAVMVLDGSARWRRWWADLYLYRGALQSLARRNVQSRYKQAGLGVAWALIQPALQVGVFTLLFGILAKIPSGGVPYPLFALAGLLPWNLFVKSISEGAVSLVTYQSVISKLYFPRIYLVVAAAASAVVDAAVTTALLLVAMWWYGVHPGIRVILAIPALVGTLLFALGFASLLAAANARWRDVQHTLPFLTQVGMYVTPVIYRTSFVPERWRWLLALNPLTALIEVFRAAALGLPMPDARVIWTSLAMSLVMIVAGVVYFRRTEATMVDVL